MSDPKFWALFALALLCWYIVYKLIEFVMRLFIAWLITKFGRNN